MALDPLTRIILLDLTFSIRSVNALEVATAISKAINLPCMPAAFINPVEYMVQDFLAPLYDDTLMPIDARNLVRTKYHDPIPHNGTLQITPSDLESALIMAVPMQLLASLLRRSIVYALSPGLFPHDETPSAIIVIDATVYRMEMFFESTAASIEVEHCLAIRIRDANGKTQIFEEVPCRSINMVVDGGVTTEELANLIPSSTIVGPNMRVTHT